MLSYGILSHAGTMGSVIDKTPVPYLQGEALYSWNQIKNINSNGLIPSLSKEYWGGRLSGGVIRPYNERILFNAEVGGGYYGGATRRVPGVIDNHLTIDGYDVLLGIIYKLQYFDVYGDIGFMAQNLSQKTTLTASSAVTGGANQNSVIEENGTHVLPEIKVGGLYHLIKNLDLSLSYMYVFGYKNYSTSSNIAPSGVTPATTNQAKYGKNPALSTLFLGLRYYFF
ncbi:hypothetical protein LOR_50c09850 [Legionella oakridgensis RV-2-2007]|nr:hypothetical protein LOR_50c09850 [Legionella oakridgensis RV-2-2007]